MSRTRAEALRRLRESLYRPDPPPGAAERYRALTGVRRTPPEPVPAGAVAPAAPARPTVPARRRRRARIVAAGVAGVLVVAAGGAVAVTRSGAVGSGPATEPLITGGPYAVRDQEALGRMLDPLTTDADAVLDAVRGSTMPQLAVWDTAEAGAWIQRGRGPRSDRAGRDRPSDAVQRFSLVVRCTAASGYRWTLSGTTPERPQVHALAIARADRCGSVPTVTTFALPVGTVIQGVELIVPDGSRWATAVVYRSR